MDHIKKIRWEYEGKPDCINGTGAYTEEKVLGYLGGALILALMIYQLYRIKQFYETYKEYIISPMVSQLSLNKRKKVNYCYRYGNVQ